MNQPILMTAGGEEAAPEAVAFYRHVLETLSAAQIPFLVGGAYAFNCFTGIARPTKDLDLFIRRRDYDAVEAALGARGYRTEIAYPHWLAKARSNGHFVDIIFNSGNGIAEVDDIWFQHAIECDVLGVPAKLSPAEEMIWSKAFIMERERYDGADIVHLILVYGEKLDWQRLLLRFGAHWRVLLAHLTLYGFAYPSRRDVVPAWLMEELIDRLQRETQSPPTADDTCSGTLLSREQYLTDIRDWGYRDARLAPTGSMTPGETAIWTAAIASKDEH